MGVVNFYITHFEKYNTGVMYLPVAYDYVMCVSIDHVYYLQIKSLNENKFNIVTI